MVAIRTHEADRFLSADLTGFCVFLVFGPDVGLVSERIGAILKALVDDPADPFQMVRLGGDDVAGDPGRLADEANTIPLFGGRRAVRIDATARNLVPAIENHIEAGTGCPVVIEAGNLKKDAALRKVVERSKAAVAIECFPDVERDLMRLIDAEAASAGLTVDPDARALLLTLLGADRIGSRSEIAKLALYAHGRGTITLDDVEAVVTDAAALATDALIDATFLGDLAAMEQAGRRVLLDGTDAGTVLMAALRHATFLHRAKLDGSASEQGSARLPFGASPKRKGAIDQQLRAARSEVLGRAVIRLGEAVGRARREPAMAKTLAMRTLWTVARSMGRRG
jgi:DNA polymerase-3 subunit delta